MTNNNYRQPHIIPVAIIIIGLLVAGAIFFSNNNSSNQQTEPVENNTGQPVSPSSSGSRSINNIQPVSSKDHIFGDPDALVKLIEFSDTECPFCKRFHPTMQRLMAEYGATNQLAWVYRHFPLDQIHSKARQEAQATECANELGGNNKFWDYLDKLFKITPSNDRLDLALLPQIAEEIGLNRSKFESCLNSNKYAQHIEDDYQDALASGGTGTPYSIVIAPNGKKFPINGAQPYSAVKSVIELALKEK